MWALFLKFIVMAGATLAGSALMRIFTRFGIYFSILYGSEIMWGNNPAASLLDMILHPNAFVSQVGDAAFGASGQPGWPQFILYLTDFWTPFTHYVSAACAWFITKQIITFAPSK